MPLTIQAGGSQCAGDTAIGRSFDPGWNDAAAALDAMLGGGVGPLTSEGLFLIMCEMVESQNVKLAEKVKAFRENTALQNKYNEFTGWMQAAQSAATGAGGACLSRDDVGTMLRGMGYEGDDLERMTNAIMANDTGGKGGWIEPNELANYVNGLIFGDDNQHLYVQLEAPRINDDGDYTSGSFLSAHFETIGEKVDAKQKTVCGDTSLMTSEISQLVSEQERLTNMFTNILKKFHDTEMAVIRNI